MANWFEFIWDVPTEGHRWVDLTEERRKTPHITPKAFLGETVVKWPSSPEGHERLNDEVPKPAKAVEVAQYAPLEQYPDLYETFAQTEDSRDGILAFADQYGLLERPAGLFSPKTMWVTENMGYSIYAEPFSKWRREIWAMRNALELWDAVRFGETGVLKQRIVWGKGGFVQYKSFDGDETPRGRTYSRTVIARPTVLAHREFYEHTKAGDSRNAALYYLQEVINKRLDEKLSAKLLWNSDMSRLELRLVPSDLLSAMWFQLSQTLIRLKAIRQCEVCGQPLPIKDDKRNQRRDTKYCSEACRSKAYRDRKRQADLRE